MKIIYITNSRMPTEKAHGYQIVEMCERFAKIGCEVELVVPSRLNYIKRDLFQYYNIKQNFTFKVVKLFDFFKYEKYLGGLTFYLQSLAFFIKLLFKEFDRGAIIYTRNPEIIWLFRKRGFKTCYECHDWFGKHKSVALYLLGKTNYIITTNNFIKNEFVNNGFKENMILVAPHGVDQKIFDLNITKEIAIDKLSISSAIKKLMRAGKVLLYTGSLKTVGQAKGIEEILKALKILDDRNLIFLAVGGSSADIFYYEEQAKKIGVLDNVYFLPRQSQQQLAIFQKATDILLMPFPKIAHYEYFMTPLKMFEYVIAGRPIISSDLPSIREILNDRNCLFCEPGNFEDLAKKIKQVLSDPVLAHKLSHQAYLSASQYTWDKRAKNIIEFVKLEIF
jgi:glycosyltransferase involved in cell wall biosynthesis